MLFNSKYIFQPIFKIIFFLFAFQTYSQKEIPILDTLKNGNVLKIVPIQVSQNLKTEQHYLYNPKGKKLYYRKYNYAFNDYIGATTENLVEEKITRRGINSGIKPEKTPDGYCKHEFYENKYDGYNLDSSAVDTIENKKSFYSTTSDSLKWLVYKNGKFIYENLNEQYRRDSILITTEFINGKLSFIEYSYPFSCEIIKSIEYDSDGTLLHFVDQQFYPDKVSVKSWTDYYFDKNKLDICKSKWKLNSIHTKCKTFNNFEQNFD